MKPQKQKKSHATRNNIDIRRDGKQCLGNNQDRFETHGMGWDRNEKEGEGQRAFI